MHKLILIILLILQTGLFSKMKVEELTARLHEIDKHPNPELRKKLRDSAKELVAIEFIKLTDEQKYNLEKVLAKHKKACEDWEAKNGERFKEVLAKTKELRFSTGEGVNEEYKKVHKLKCQIAQTKPQIDKVKILTLLTETQKAEFTKHLATLNFWYGGHGERARIMMLIKAGAPPKKAIEMFYDYSTKMKDFKEKARQGVKLDKPDFHKEYLAPLEKNNAN